MRSAGGHEVGRAFLGHLRDECDDGLLGLAVVPGGQRVLGMGYRSQQSQAIKTVIEQDAVRLFIFILIA